ncbi:MAG: hypothetical protein RIR33_3701 [Pseudomonadota bacterium]|jgi:hypothetical protein
MANFFSAEYWKALYFKAMGGQETAVDPNAMSGSFAGSSSWTGALEQPEGAVSGTFAGSSTFSGTLTAIGAKPSQDFRNVLDGVRRFWPVSALASFWERERREKLEREARLRFEEGSISGAFAGSSSFTASIRTDAKNDEDETEIMILLLAA